MKTKHTRISLFAVTVIMIALPSISQASQPIAVDNGSAEKVEITRTIGTQKSNIDVSARMSLGILYGEVNEYVYSDSGSKMSHLKWQMDNVAMVGVGMSITPTNWLKFNADGSFAVWGGSGEMEDYDWFVTGYDWTNWSTHDDTEVDGLVLFDINAEFTFFQEPKKDPKSRIFGILGYKHDNFEWSAYGGSYIYSVNGFRDEQGTASSSQKVISYEQTYNTPYIGIGFEADVAQMTFSGRLVYSPFASLEAVDNHYVRDLEYTDDIDEITFFGLNLAAAYRINEKLRITGNFSYSTYDETKGSTTIRDLTTGTTTHYSGDVAGADNNTYQIMLGVVYEF